MKKLLIFSMAAVMLFAACSKDGETPDVEMPDDETPDDETPDDETPDDETPDADKPLTISAPAISGLGILPTEYEYEISAFAGDPDWEIPTLLASAPFGSSDHSFSITLPAPPPVLYPAADFKIPVDAELEIVIASVYITFVDEEVGLVGAQIAYGKGPSLYTLYLYATEAFKYSGPGIDPEDGKETFTFYDLDCKAGWNTIACIENEDDPEYDSTITSTIPSGLNWVALIED